MPTPIPDLSSEMLGSVRATIAVVGSQLYNVLRLRYAPGNDAFIEELVGNYALGFLNGHLQATGATALWSKGDEGLEVLGWLSCAAAVLTGVLEASRVLPVSELLPQMRGEIPSARFQAVDMAGGADGIAAARDQPMPKGGQLAFLLEANIPRSARGRIRNLAEELALDQEELGPHYTFSMYAALDRRASELQEMKDLQERSVASAHATAHTSPSRPPTWGDRGWAGLLWFAVTGFVLVFLLALPVEIAHISDRQYHSLIYWGAFTGGVVGAIYGRPPPWSS